MKTILIGFGRALILGLLACNSGSNVEIIRPAPGELFDLTFDHVTYITSVNFETLIDNPFFSQIPGTKRTFLGTNEDGESVEVIEEVLSNFKSILGIDCTVVLVKEWEDGELTEETLDFYAQDKDGNVWYLGEEVDNLEDGQLTDHHGAWEAGVDGAVPGIIMPAQPEIGLKYRQEFLENEAEDIAEVISLDETITIGLGTYSNVLKTEEWSPLEPSSREYKFYAKDLGLLKIEAINDPSFEELVSLVD